MPYDEWGTWIDEPATEWYNPATGEVEPIAPAHVDPYTAAHTAGRGDEFDQATQDYYFGDGINTGEHPNTNWYQPETYNWLLNNPTPTPGNPPPPAPGPGPRPSPTPRSTGGIMDLGPLLQPYPGSFQRPVPGEAFKQLSDLLGPAPAFEAPSLPTIAPFAEPEPFSFEEYAPTTGADVFADPSFEFRKGIGEKALLNSRSAQGLLRTGGTLKDLLDYNQNFATQDFGNVDARRFRDYGMRRGNALETYQTNLQNKKSVYDTNTANTLGLYDRGFEAERAKFEPKLFEWNTKGQLGARAEEQAYDNAFDEFMADYNIWRNSGNDVFDRLKWASEFGLDAATR